MINLVKTPVQPTMLYHGRLMHTAVEFARKANVPASLVWAEVNSGWLKASIIDNTIYIASTEMAAFTMRKGALL